MDYSALSLEQYNAMLHRTHRSLSDVRSIQTEYKGR